MKYWNTEIKLTAEKMCRNGMKLTEIAKQLNVPRSTVGLWLVNMRENKRKEWNDEMKSRCIELRKSGFSYKQIIAMTGVPATTLRNWFPQELQMSRNLKIRTMKKGEIRKNGLIYKIGIRGHVFYLSDLGEWRKSSLTREEIGFL